MLIEDRCEEDILWLRTSGRARQNRIIDAYLHYRQEELLELERANDPTIHTNADGVMFIDTAVRHVESGVTERCTHTQHGQQSRKSLEETTPTLHAI